MGKSAGIKKTINLANKNPFSIEGANARMDPLNLFGGRDNREASPLNEWGGMGGIERAAGVTAPKYQTLRDAAGNLQDKYKINPFSGEASQKLRAEALGSGPSEWAKNALSKQGFEQTQAMGNALQQQQAAQSGAQAQLARFGGLGGGARTSLARSGARDALMAGQGVAAQGINQRYAINDADMKRRQDLLGATSGLEQQADAANLNQLTGDIKGQSAFDMDRYKSILQAYGANQSANATIAAGNKGGGKK